MLQPDVVTIRQFYSSPLGIEVRRALIRAMLRYWPTAKGEVVLGLGYALPYLRVYLEQAEQLISCMPRSMGAIYWPADTPNRSLLINEAELPLRDQSVNRIIVAHTLEHVPHLNSVLKEVFRVLVPGGRALLLVPNRHGVWIRAGHTPMGSGTPFNLTQLRHRASLAGLTFVRGESALFFPPSRWRLMIRLAPWFEILGRLLLPGVGGMMVCEVEKQIYAAIAVKAEEGLQASYAQPSPAGI